MNLRPVAGLWTGDGIGREDLVDPDRIPRAQHGDVAAFTELIEARIPAMTRTATAILGHDADARDAVQDALVAAWPELPRPREPGSFDAWLARILMHCCRRTIRRARAARALVGSAVLFAVATGAVLRAAIIGLTAGSPKRAPRGRLPPSSEYW